MLVGALIDFVRERLDETLDERCQREHVIETGNLCGIASAFTFGREDLLPDVFQRVVDELNVETSGDLDDFRFYLSRHIELDGDHHGPMATRMIARLCDDDDIKWRVVEDAAVGSLQARKALWDGMYESMRAAPQASASVS